MLECWRSLFFQCGALDYQHYIFCRSPLACYFTLLPTGAKSSPSKGSVNKKLTPVQYRPVRSQIRRRLKLVANSSAGSPAYRLTEEGKEPTLKASWWDTTPHDHVVNYIASCLYPMRGGQIRAAGMFYSVGNFWLTWVPVVSK